MRQQYVLTFEEIFDLVRNVEPASPSKLLDVPSYPCHIQAPQLWFGRVAIVKKLVNGGRRNDSGDGFEVLYLVIKPLGDQGIWYTVIGDTRDEQSVESTSAKMTGKTKEFDIWFRDGTNQKFRLYEGNRWQKFVPPMTED